MDPFVHQKKRNEIRSTIKQMIRQSTLLRRIHAEIIIEFDSDPSTNIFAMKAGKRWHPFRRVLITCATITSAYWIAGSKHEQRRSAYLLLDLGCQLLQ